MKGWNRKLFVIGMALLVMASACAAPATPIPPTATSVPPTATPVPPTPTPPPPTPTPGPLETLKTFEAAANRQDAGGVMGLFVDQPSWDFLLRGATSAKAVRNILDLLFQYHGQWQINDCKAQDGSVACTVLQKDDCAPTAFVHFASTFVFKGGKIASFAGQPNADEIAVAADWSNKSMDWAKQNLPEDYARLIDEAEWVKFTGNGDQGDGKLSAIELGQVNERVCTAYAKSIK